MHTSFSGYFNIFFSFVYKKLSSYWISCCAYFNLISFITVFGGYVFNDIHITLQQKFPSPFRILKVILSLNGCFLLFYCGALNFFRKAIQPENFFSNYWIIVRCSVTYIELVYWFLGLINFISVFYVKM